MTVKNVLSRLTCFRVIYIRTMLEARINNDPLRGDLSLEPVS